MNNAVVFRLYGDPKTGNAIKEGMMKQTRLASKELEVVKAELTSLKARDARNGVKEPREKAYWQDMIDDARERHAISATPSGVREKLLQVYALLCLGVDSAFKRLQAINREV